MANPETAVTVAPSVAVEVNLDQWPSERYNRLIPTQTIRMPSDLFVPIIVAVQLDLADRDGKSADHYKSSDVPSGHRAPTARALNKLATAAGVSFFDEVRTDDGADPDVMGVRVMATMLLPTGQRITAPGSQVINLRTWFGTQSSAAEVGKFRKQFYAHTATRAKNRAIRGILSLRASYPEADIAKPFAVVSFAPNLNHPAVQAAYVEAMVPALEASYGPGREPRKLVAGPSETVVDEAPPAPQELPGESIAAAHQDEDAPAWLTGAPVAATETKPAAKPAPSLVDRLRDSAEVSGMQGEATPVQRERLKALFAELDWTTEIRPVLEAAFGDVPATLTAAQAQAIANLADAFESAEPPLTFREEWSKAAAIARKVA